MAERVRVKGQFQGLPGGRGFNRDLPSVVDSSVDSHWAITLGKTGSLSELGQRWHALEERSHCSFFQSWNWIEPWLSTIGSQVARVMLLEATYRGRPVLLGLLGRRAARKPGLGSSSFLHVSETGIGIYDDLTIEHNGLLIEHEYQEEALKRCFSFLFEPAFQCKEFVVSGLEERNAGVYMRAARERGCHPRVVAEHPYFRVDLADLRKRGVEYLCALSANTRYQVRRALREYERRGPVTIEIARTRDEAQAFFRCLQELHQRRWVERGQRGAFSEDAMVRFHRQLVDRCVPDGHIQLIRVAAGSTPFAYLYNFVFRGVVYNYQSGFLYEQNHKRKPGLLSHALAIQYNLELGHKHYDLLMGAQRYKRSLAEEQGVMVRLAIRRRRRGLGTEQARRVLEWAAGKVKPTSLHSSK